MTDFVWKKEPRLGIKSARFAVKGHALSGVVHIVEAGRGLAYITFMQTVVERIGKHMPEGIGPENPAFLKVVRKGEEYEIYCEYLDKSRSVPLWKSTQLPSFIRRVKHANQKETHSQGSTGGPPAQPLEGRSGDDGRRGLL